MGVMCVPTCMFLWPHPSTGCYGRGTAVQPHVAVLDYVDEILDEHRRSASCVRVDSSSRLVGALHFVLLFSFFLLGQHEKRARNDVLCCFLWVGGLGVMFGRGS